MPVYSLIGAWLVFELLHESLHGDKVFLLWPVLIHAGHEMSGAYLVEVIILKSVTAYLSLCINHSIGIHLAILAYVLVAILKICVEHGFEFDAHDITPLRFFCKVEHIRLGHSLHLGVCHPLAVGLIWFIL